MTYLYELRESLVQAAHRQQAAQQDHVGDVRAQQPRTERPLHPRGWRMRPGAVWWRSVHGGRAVLASVALGLAGTAMGVVQVGAPLGPEPQPSRALTQAVGSPQQGESSP